MYDSQPEAAHHYQVPEQTVRPAAEHSVLREPTPPWVKPATLPDSQSEYEEVLGDIQLNPELKTYYVHTARRLKNIDFEQHANIELSFNPYHENLTLHSCKIIRSGQKIDRLHNAKIHLIQREPKSEGFNFRGNLQTSLFLDDIQEGDLLEYSYSVQGAHFDRWGWRLPLTSSIPIEKLHIRITKPQRGSVHIRHSDPDSNATITEDEFALTLEPCSAWKNDPYLPLGYTEAPYVEFTEFETWNQVIQEILDFHKIDPAFALNKEASKLIATWKDESSTLEEAALKALRFVQDEIRYLALYGALGGWKPANPSGTLKRKHGDCKAKSQLFCAFLELLDIPSVPFLVNSKTHDGINDFIPQNIFDHVIVRIDLPDGPVYVDPTAINDGGSLHESYLPYHRGLAISKDTKELSSISIQYPEIDLDRTTSFAMKDNGVELTISSYFYGKNAGWLRSKIASHGPKKHAQQVKEYYEDLYGPTDLVSYDYQDDHKSNCILGTCTILLKNPWKKDRDKENFFDYQCKAFSSYFLQSFDNERKTPLSLPTPKRIKETIHVSELALEGPSKAIEHPTFQFAIYSPSEKRADIELNSELDRLEPEELEEYAKKLQEGRNSCIIRIYEHSKARRNAIQVAKILSRP